MTAFLDKITHELSRCQRLLDTNALEDDSTLSQSVFIELLIRLNDMLYVLDRSWRRVKRSDDVQMPVKQKKAESIDITDLVFFLRNAVCHVDTDKDYIDRKGNSARFVFNRFIGKCSLMINGHTLGCDYSDDTAFYYGATRIYLVRHIKRLIGEIPLLANDCANH